MTTIQFHDDTRTPDVDPETVTISGYAVDRVYDVVDGRPTDPANDAAIHPRIGAPDEFPFTQGIHACMYRDRLWTMRKFAGFGSADDTNARLKYLLENAKGTKANTGLSTAFDPRLSFFFNSHNEFFEEICKLLAARRI